MRRLDSISCFAALVTMSAVPVTASVAQAVASIDQLVVTDHFFTTRLSSGNRLATIKDPTRARYVVFAVGGTLDSAGRVFTNDFTLRYRNDGHEDRNRCEGVARAPDGEIGQFVVGSGAWIKLEEGQVRFAVACVIENTVDQVDLYRMGVSTPIRRELGTGRPFSVLLNTNTSLDRRDRAESALQDGGYRVVTSDRLNKSTRGVTIHYATTAEREAREISQRLMTVLGVAPVLKKSELISKYDVVVWLGASDTQVASSDRRAE